MNKFERGSGDLSPDTKNELQVKTGQHNYYELSAPRSEIIDLYETGGLVRIENPHSYLPDEAIKNFQQQVYEGVRECIRSGHLYTSMEGVQDYFSALELTSESPLIVCSDDIQTKNDISDFLKIGDYILQREIYGIFLPDYNIALALKGSQRESRTHIVTLVHELTHTTGGIDYGFYQEKGAVYFCATRQGFSELDQESNFKERGYFIEEGRAELIASHYPSSEPLRSPINHRRQLYIPGKYLNNEGTYAASAFAAIGLELLILRNPALFDLVIKSDRSKEGRVQFFEKVERIERGLYSRMSNTSNSPDHFKDLTTYILNTHFNRNCRAPLIADKLCTALFEQRLKKS